jgi:hypothetical protein
MSQLPLVASAISSIINSPVKTYDECVKDGLKVDPSQILDLDTIFKKSLTLFEFKNIEDIDPPEVIPSCSTKQIQIFVKPIDGNSQSMFVDPSITVLTFKDSICAKFEYNIRTMRLIFGGKQLDDNKTLASYGIQKGDTIQVLSRVFGGFNFYVINNNLLDPTYDYDFTNLTDSGTIFTRGKETYKRPCGWKRIALNVRKYGHDKRWLGRVGNSSYEWPVSYHGTKKEFANSIANEGYLLSRGERFLYGRGIYSTPVINIAERFAAEFDNNGIRYKVVFQNRANPVGLKKVRNDTYWITPRDEDIRPYGLCIREVCRL